MPFKNKFISLVLPLLISLPGLFYQSTSHGKTLSSSSDSAGSFDVETILANLSLKQKVGQLFIFGFAGTQSKQHLVKTIKDLIDMGVLF